MLRQRGRGDGRSTSSVALARTVTACIAGSVAATLLAVMLAGCFGPKPEVLMPTTVGVVVQVERLAGRSVAYQLASGDVVDVDLATANILLPDGGAGEGMLLLSGTDASGRNWIAGLAPSRAANAPPDCFLLLATGTGVDGSIDLSNGMRLRKAPDFDPGPASNDRYDLDRVTFCINANGEVMSYG